MTLKQYAKLIDKVLMCEAAWVCADSHHIKVFKRQPELIETGSKNLCEWVGKAGQYPVMVIKYNPKYDLDLEEYRTESGEIAWDMVKIKI